MKSPFQFAQHGQCGKMVSEIFPHLGRHVDKMAFIHSCYTESNNHSPALFMINTGMPRMGFPCVGSWVTYGLGSESREPAGVRRDERHAGPRPAQGPRAELGRGFLPGVYQGTHLKPKGAPIDNLERPGGMTDDAAARAARPAGQAQPAAPTSTIAAEAELAARIESFELAYRMQIGRPGGDRHRRASRSTIKRLYGLDDPQCDHFARQCLTARRLVERGVRFVQIYSGGMENQRTLGRPHRHQGQPRAVRRRDRPADRRPAGRPRAARAARRDAGHLGRRVRPPADRPERPEARAATTTRTPSRSGWPAAASRAASATARPTRSATRPPSIRVHINDLHATILHLLGLDHTRLTYRYNGRDSA